MTPPRQRPPFGVSLACAFLAGALSGCAEQAPGEVFGAQPTPSPNIVILTVPSAAAVTAGAGDAGDAGDAVSFRDVGGVMLPDPDSTPGDVFDDVTPTQLCDVHYSLGVRQPRFNDKVNAFEEYGISIRQRDDYQVDRLIPVSLGGSNALTNLWPQPYAGRGAHEKDELEAHLRRLVCSSKVGLGEAQRAIAEDWLAAGAKYLLVAAPPEDLGYRTGTPVDKSVDPFEVTNGGPCPTEGESGRTEGKGIVFTCQRAGDGPLRWGKRY